MKILMIESPNDIGNVNRFNVRIFIIPMCQFIFAAALILFVIRDAGTIAEYSDCLYALTITLTLIAVVIVIYRNILNIFELIENIESHLKTREFRN